MDNHGVPILMDEHDVKAYRDLVEQVPDHGKILELGCAVGGSLVAISDIILRKKLKVWAVDVWDIGGIGQTHPAMIAFYQDITRKFYTNVHSVGLDPMMICGTSEKVARIVGEFPLNRQLFDMIFIDADHSYEALKQDVELLEGLVCSGGILAGHDYGNENKGVKLFIDERFPGAKITGSWIWSVRV